MDGTKGLERSSRYAATEKRLMTNFACPPASSPLNLFSKSLPQYVHRLDPCQRPLRRVERRSLSYLREAKGDRTCHLRAVNTSTVCGSRWAIIQTYRECSPLGAGADAAPSAHHAPLRLLPVIEKMNHDGGLGWRRSRRKYGRGVGAAAGSGRGAPDAEGHFIAGRPSAQSA